MSNTIYVPSFPGSSGATGILPGFKQGGFGSGGGGGPQPLSLPVTVGFESTPTFSASGLWNGLDGTIQSQASSVATPTVEGYKPATFTNSLRIASAPDNYANLSYIPGAPISLASGLRIMYLTYTYDTDGFSRYPSYVIYLSNSQTTHSAADSIGGTIFNNKASSLYENLGENNNPVRAYATGPWTNDLDAWFKTWAAVGMEIPANGVGDVKYRFKTFGTGDGATYSAGQTHTIGTLTYDFSSTTFDRVNIRNTGNGYGDTNCFHWLWIGSLTDDWPV